MLNPLLLGLAAMATLLALAVAGILAALYRKHSTGRPGSPKHAPIVCEPPNAGATTPVHSQTKQAVDDIDPDIIPNEYGKYVSISLEKVYMNCVYWPFFYVDKELSYHLHYFSILSKSPRENRSEMIIIFDIDFFRRNIKLLKVKLPTYTKNFNKFSNFNYRMKYWLHSETSDAFDASDSSSVL